MSSLPMECLTERRLKIKLSLFLTKYIQWNQNKERSDGYNYSNVVWWKQIQNANNNPVRKIFFCSGILASAWLLIPRNQKNNFFHSFLYFANFITTIDVVFNGKLFFSNHLHFLENRYPVLPETFPLVVHCFTPH